MKYGDYVEGTYKVEGTAVTVRGLYLRSVSKSSKWDWVLLEDRAGVRYQVRQLNSVHQIPGKPTKQVSGAARRAYLKLMKHHLTFKEGLLPAEKQVLRFLQTTDLEDYMLRTDVSKSEVLELLEKGHLPIPN